MGKLFREEVIEHQRIKWIGKALLVSGLPTWLIGLASSIFVITVIIFLTFGNYTRRINVYGEVITQPRSVNIFSSQVGFISQQFVDVGDKIKKGQLLYEIDISRVTDSGKVSANIRHAIENQLKQVNDIIQKLQTNKDNTLENLRSQKRQYEIAHEQSKKLVESAHQGVDFSRQTMQNYKEYQERGLVTKDQLSGHTHSYYQLQSAFQGLYSQHIQESLQIINLRSEIVIKAADFDNQISQYQFQRNDLQRQLTETDASGSIVINAPTDGRIESLSVTLGQMVNTGDSLAQIIPRLDATYYLVLWLPNNSVPYISRGDPINIRYDAFPFEKFGQFPGRIDSIAYVPASTQEMATYNSSPVHPTNERANAYYKVMAVLDNNQLRYQGKMLHLSSGMKAQATLFLERRPLYQWMFSPFYDMKKSLMGPIND